ncbi:MAG: hypothetical protein V1724_07795 [Chloroflexota bacterium]
MASARWQAFWYHYGHRLLELSCGLAWVLGVEDGGDNRDARSSLDHDLRNVGGVDSADGQEWNVN